MKNLKALGLAALIVAALVALPASAYATSGLTLKGSTSPSDPPRITSSISPAKLSGGIFNMEMEGWSVAGEEPFKFGSQTLSCSKVAYESAEFSEALFNEFSLTPQLGGCVFGGYSATVNPHSCKYRFSELVPGNAGEATASIVCNGSEAIDIEAAACKISIPAQTLTEPAGVMNPVVKEEGTIGVAMTGNTLKYTASGSYCSLMGVETGSRENGVSNTYSLLRGVKGSGSGEPKPNGLTLKGGPSPADPPRIISSKSPAKLSGGIFNLETEGWSVAGEKPFKFGSQTLSCSKVAYEGTEFSEALFNEFSLTPQLGGCVFGGYSTPFNPHSCKYRFSELVPGSAGEATASIVCNGSDTIDIESPGCKISISAQTLTEPAGVINPIVKEEGTIGVAMTGNNLKYTASGSLCSLMGVETGSRENGVSNTYSLLRGV